MVRNLRCAVIIDSVLANPKRQNAFLFPVHAMFCHDCPLGVKPTSTPRRLVHKKTWRDSLPIDMLLHTKSVLVVAQPISEVPEELMNYPVFFNRFVYSSRYVSRHKNLIYLLRTITYCIRLYFSSMEACFEWRRFMHKTFPGI